MIKEVLGLESGQSNPIPTLKALLASPAMAAAAAPASPFGQDVAAQFQEADDVVILLGAVVDAADPLLGLGGSAYLEVIHRRKAGTPPSADSDQAGTLRTTFLGLIQAGLLRSAVPCREGGLAVAVANGCARPPASLLLGATIDLRPFQDLRLDALLFGETPNRIVVSCRPLDAVKVIERSKLLGVPAARIGLVVADRLVLQTSAGELGETLAALYEVPHPGPTALSA